MALALLLSPVPVLAACAGTDLADTLTVEEAATVNEALDTVPYPVGNHWRATRGDARIHLIGTVHVGDDRLAGPVSRLAPVIETADALLLEATSEAQASLTAAIADTPSLLVLDGPSLPDRLPEETWQALQTALSDRGIPGMIAARMRPWYLSVLLGMPPCLDLASATDTGMDAQLETIAEEAGVATRSLENPRGVLEAFASVPFETQMAMVQSALIPSDVAEDMLETMMAAYLREETARAWALSAVMAERHAPLDGPEADAAFAALEKTLLADRNRAWIPVILDTAQDVNGPVVAAFGAAHLSGEDGILSLLEAEGFTLERQPF